MIRNYLTLFGLLNGLAYGLMFEWMAIMAWGNEHHITILNWNKYGEHALETFFVIPAVIAFTTLAIILVLKNWKD